MAELSTMTVKPPNLDPIAVYMNDIAPGRGELTVTCYGLAWTCYWGGMGEDRTVRQFVAGTGPDYIAGCLICGRDQFSANQRTHKREVEYLTRIAEAVINAAKDAPEVPRG